MTLYQVQLLVSLRTQAEMAKQAFFGEIKMKINSFMSSQPNNVGRPKKEPPVNSMHRKCFIDLNSVQ